MDKNTIQIQNLKSKEIKPETTFTKLKNLQILLKKESALKGLYTETGKNTQKDIENLCKDIFKKKIEVLNVLKNDPYSNLIVNYFLVEDNKNYLKTLYLYIPRLLTYLWENPSLIATLFIHSNKNDIKKYLAPLICNNFYENILSSNYIEDQLIYVIYLLLENEIENLNSINDYKKFLNNSPCGFLLDELFDRKDIKAFFKMIFKDIIEILELSCGDIELFLDPFRIEQNILVKQNSFKKSLRKHSSKNNDLIVNSQKQQTEEDKKNHEIFFSKYLIDLPLKKLTELKEKYKSDKNKKMENYIDFQLNGQTKDEIYSNKEFFKLMNNNSIYTYDILINYEKSFIKVIEFINSFINTILENIDLLPYSIRCICKIISSLLDKKFKNISTIDKNLFIGQFFVNKLLLPMLVNPATGAFINNYIISNNTLHNLHTISHLVTQFFSFRLFNSEEKGMYSPFNFYFLENIKNIFDIFEFMTKVKLPSFIDKLINSEISKNNYEYNYFKENKNEILFHRTIFLSVNHIKVLLNNITQIKDFMYKKDDKSNKEFQLIISKLVDNNDNVRFLTTLCDENDLKVKKTIKADKSKGIKKMDKKEQNIKYFLISDLLYNEKYQNLLSLDNAHSHSYFKLKEKKVNLSDEKDNKEII